MKTNFYVIGAIIVMAVLIHVLLSQMVSMVESEQHEYESKLGEKVYIDGDTLTIIDYSLWNETFILSNGSKISHSFVWDKKD